MLLGSGGAETSDDGFDVETCVDVAVGGGEAPTASLYPSLRSSCSIDTCRSRKWILLVRNM